MDILRPNVIEINGRRYRRLIWSSGQTDEPYRDKIEEKVDPGGIVPTDCRFKGCYSLFRHF